MLNCHQCASMFFKDISLFSHTKTDTPSVDHFKGENLATAVDTDTSNVNTKAEGTEPNIN